MSPQIPKQPIFDACRLNLISAIQLLEEEMNMLKESASSEQDGGMSDRLESTDEEMMNDRKDRENHRATLYQDLSLLDSLSSADTLTAVAPGAVVITDVRNLVVAIARTFRACGQDYTGISVAAPIFAVIEGKKAGDSYTFNGQQYKIIQVY